jgi:branched-chain amino acid transport system substrate-binding protein
MIQGEMNLKKPLRILMTTLTIGAVVMLTACGGNSTASNSGGNKSPAPSGGEQKTGTSGDKGGTIKIGMMADLSGKTALSGKFKKMGAELAVEEINAQGGIAGKKLELIVEDNQGTQQGTVASFQKMTSDKDMVAVIGSIRSTNVKAMNTYAQKAGLPVAIGGTNTGLTTELKNKWYFRFRPHDGYAAESIADYSVNKIGKKKIAIIHDTDAFGTGGKDLLVEDYKKLGAEVVDIEGYNTGTKDFAPFIKKIADSGAEVLNTYMTASEDAGQMMKQIREKGYKFEVVGSPSIAQETTLKIAGDSLNGIYSVNDFALDQSDVTKEFVKKFKDKYKENPDVYTAWPYDALYIFKKVIEEKKSTKPDDIRDGILAIKDYKGAEGNYSFDEHGDGLHSYSIVKVDKGSIVTVK